MGNNQENISKATPDESLPGLEPTNQGGDDEQDSTRVPFDEAFAMAVAYDKRKDISFADAEHMASVRDELLLHKALSEVLLDAAKQAESGEKLYQMGIVKAFVPRVEEILHYDESGRHLDINTVKRYVEVRLRMDQIEKPLSVDDILELAAENNRLLENDIHKAEAIQEAAAETERSRQKIQSDLGGLAGRIF